MESHGHGLRTPLYLWWSPAACNSPTQSWWRMGATYGVAWLTITRGSPLLVKQQRPGMVAPDKQHHHTCWCMACSTVWGAGVWQAALLGVSMSARHPV
jgi:hypothetical protein